MADILSVISTLFIVYFFVKSMLDMRRWFHQQLPNEVLKLVKQAHKGESFSTEPYIYMSVLICANC